ncbi:MAG: hypothetical protein ABIG92_03930 [Candidatus Omnitrophota bacterium]
MAIKRVPFLLILAALISLGIFSVKGFGKEEKPKAQDSNLVISEKINEILKNQQDIVKRLEDIREQLDIIRVRASRN